MFYSVRVDGHGGSPRPGRPTPSGWSPGAARATAGTAASPGTSGSVPPLATTRSGSRPGCQRPRCRNRAGPRRSRCPGSCCRLIAAPGGHHRAGRPGTPASGTRARCWLRRESRSSPARHGAGDESHHAGFRVSPRQRTCRRAVRRAHQTVDRHRLGVGSGVVVFLFLAVACRRGGLQCGGGGAESGGRAGRVLGL